MRLKNVIKESSRSIVLAASLGRFHGEKLHGNREADTLGYKEAHFQEASLISPHIFPHLNTHRGSSLQHSSGEHTHLCVSK